MSAVWEVFISVIAPASTAPDTEARVIIDGAPSAILNGGTNWLIRLPSAFNPYDNLSTVMLDTKNMFRMSIGVLSHALAAESGAARRASSCAPQASSDVWMS